jgi:hypothetical protein
MTVRDRVSTVLTRKIANHLCTDDCCTRLCQSTQENDALTTRATCRITEHIRITLFKLTKFALRLRSTGFSDAIAGSEMRAEHWRVSRNWSARVRHSHRHTPPGRHLNVGTRLLLPRSPGSRTCSFSELRQKYREGQEDQLGVLGLVVNALVLWTTRYMDAALAYLRANDAVVKPEDVARLSPLSSKQFNVLGRYHFNVTDDAVRRGELRPLRNPTGFEQDVLIA